MVVYRSSCISIGSCCKYVYGYMTDKDMSTVKVVAMSVATSPISVICAPATATVGAAWVAREVINCYWGDLSPESDDEMS